MAGGTACWVVATIGYFFSYKGSHPLSHFQQFVPTLLPPSNKGVPRNIRARNVMGSCRMSVVHCTVTFLQCQFDSIVLRCYLPGSGTTRLKAKYGKLLFTVISCMVSSVNTFKHACQAVCCGLIRLFLASGFLGYHDVTMV